MPPSSATGAFWSAPGKATTFKLQVILILNVNLGEPGAPSYSMIRTKEERSTHVNDWIERAEWNYHYGTYQLVFGLEADARCSPHQSGTQVSLLFCCVVLCNSSFLSSFRCHSWSLFPTGCPSIAPCHAVLLGHVGICILVATARWS